MCWASLLNDLILHQGMISGNVNTSLGWVIWIISWKVWTEKSYGCKTVSNFTFVHMRGLVISPCMAESTTNMEMQPSPGDSTWSRSSEGLLFPTKSSKLPFLVCGVFYNTDLNLPHLLSVVPRNATLASVLVSPASWKHTFSVSHPQPLFASDTLSSFLQEPSPVLISMKIALSSGAIIGLSSE